MKRAIKLAIAAGWNPDKYRERDFYHTKGRFRFHHTTSAMVSFSEVLLDPLFWQALGKAEGWQQDQVVDRTGDLQPRQVIPGEWKAMWHRFIDHLAEGKDTDSFFKELLK